MSDMQRMEYKEVDTMVSILRISAESLEETAQAMSNIAKTMQNGALIGQGGEAFFDAIMARFVPAIRRLSDKLKQESEYCQIERDDMYEAEQRNRGLFG